jgi:hypothetical protein
MSNPRKENKIRKRDYSRVLVTETLPYETPIIFSNDGLYSTVSSVASSSALMQSLVNTLVFAKSPPKPPSSTVPFSYKIRKNSLEMRKLSLLHPASQWKIKEFYQQYEKLIIEHCSRSPASIRAPKKIASTFYSKKSWENIHKYKTGKVAEEATDRFTKHSPSYFAYRGYDRLYKFFDSPDFADLEKSFGLMWTLDVSKCFDSIYTHTLSWAVKDKAFTKEFVSVESTFAQSFDRLMQHTNHNETNGIVIGPEVSRIFAEILFQCVDVRAIQRIAGLGWVYGKHYALRRYVDDVFIFSQNAEVAEDVFKSYSDVLLTLNLYTNVAKSNRFTRPFFTKKSRMIREASAKANEFVARFLGDVKDESALVPTDIYRSWKLTRSFMNDVRAICSYNDASYDEISSYLLSVFTERVKKMANINLQGASDEIRVRYREACVVLLDVLFFLYGVAPSVSGSYKLCTSIVVLVRFSTRYLGPYNETIKQRIYELATVFLASEQISKEKSVEGFVSLEALNVVLAMRELGERYLLPTEIVERVFVGESRNSYWGVVTGLFYVRDAEKYTKIRRKLIVTAERKLSDLSDILMNAEKAYLFLDLLFCPYVGQKQKKIWIKRYFSNLEMQQPSAIDFKEFDKEMVARHWCINWSEVDLLNSLEKKELKQAY